MGMLEPRGVNTAQCPLPPALIFIQRGICSHVRSSPERGMMATLEKGAASFQGSTSLQLPRLESRTPLHVQSAEPPQHASEGCWSGIGQQCPSLTVSVPRGASRSARFQGLAYPAKFAPP